MERIPNDIQQRIRLLLASGDFDNEESVLREALDTLERRQANLRTLCEALSQNRPGTGSDFLPTAIQN